MESVVWKRKKNNIKSDDYYFDGSRHNALQQQITLHHIELKC